MAKLLSYKEVSEHNTADDLWMIIDGKVYDCTGFVEEHPGGDEILVDLGGQDATGPFEDIGHSEDAIKLLEPMYVGDVDTTSEPVAVQAVEMSSAATTGGEGNGLMIIALIAVFLGIAYYYFSQ